VQVNALSFDVEHWHEAALLQDSVTDPTVRIEDSLARVLRILDRHGVTATFFVVGELAAEFPDLVARIHDGGHELGSHGHVHESVSTFTPRTFRGNLARSADAIEDASGVRPSGFRAPNFSVSESASWVLRELAASDYAYDSSVFPMSTPMYGVAGGPQHPYEVRPDSPLEATPPIDLDPDADQRLIEVPVAVAGRHLRVPVAGGFYARTLPVSVLEWGIRWLNERGIPATLYFHPWEFNPDVVTSAPRIDKRFISFHGVDALAGKLDRLLETFAFGTVADVLTDQSLPVDSHLKESADEADEPTALEERTNPGSRHA
jgi:polysaccharide deacetylase family protein (PEP-CTERM system associated)